MNRNRRNNNRSSKNAKKEAAAMKGCACISMKLEFENDDQKSPGVVKAKIYFQRENKERMIEILRHLQIGRTEKQEDQKNILSQFEINPETCDDKSLLNFDQIFNKQDGTAEKRVYSSYIDVNLRIPLQIVMIHVKDRLKYGRVSLVSAGKKCQENDTKTLAVMQKWAPLWTQQVTSATNGDRGGMDSKIFSPQDYLCDVVRFQFQFNSEIERYNFVKIKQVDMRAFNSQAVITRPVLARQLNNTSDKPKQKSDNGESNQNLPSLQQQDQSSPLNLPLDVWLHTLDLLPSSRIQALTALAGVCQEWRRYFSQSYFYWTVDLKPIATLLPCASVEFLRFLSSNCKSTQNLRISWLPSLPPTFNLVKVFEMLQAGSLTCLIAENCAAMDDDALSKLVNMAPGLEILSLHGCFAISSRGYLSLGSLTNLRRLSIGNTDTISIEALRLVAKGCKKLEVFECSDLLRIYPYRDEDPTEVTAEILTSMASTALRAVNVNARFATSFSSANGDKKGVDEASFLRTFLVRCQNLEEFYLNGYIDAESFLKGFDDFCTRLYPVCANLRRISKFLFSSTGEEEEDEEEQGAQKKLDAKKAKSPFTRLTMCLRNFPKLERLALFDHGGDKPWDLAEVMERIPNLRQLYVWQGSDEVSDDRKRRAAARKASANNGLDRALKLKFPDVTIVRRPAWFDEDEDYYDDMDEYGSNDYDSSEEDEIDYDYYGEVYEPDSDDEKLAYYMAMNREYGGDDFDY